MLFSELEYIHFLHQFRTPVLDQFFKILDFFDTPQFIFIIVPAVWLGYHWKAGFRLFYLLLASNLLNDYLKGFFRLPRPFHLDPQVGLVKVSGYGFPSGAAQTVILLSGLLLVYWKNPWKWFVACIYISLISLSRLYLGVHFPSDILGGWMIGACLLMLFIFLQPIIETKLEQLKPSYLFLISQLIPFLLAMGLQSLAAIRVCSVAMGMGAGLLMTYRCNLALLPPKGFKEASLRAAIGIIGTFLCYALTSYLLFVSKFDLFVQFFLIGIWISLGVNAVLRSLFPDQKPSVI